MLELIEINKVSGRFPINMNNSRLSSTMSIGNVVNSGQQQQQRPQSSYSIVSTTSTNVSSSNKSSQPEETVSSSKPVAKIISSKRMGEKNASADNLDNNESSCMNGMNGHHQKNQANGNFHCVTTRSASSSLLTKRNASNNDFINDLTVIAGYEKKIVPQNVLCSSQYSLKPVEINNNMNANTANTMNDINKIINSNISNTNNMNSNAAKTRNINLSYTEQLKSLLQSHQEQRQQQEQPNKEEAVIQPEMNMERWQAMLAPISVTTNNISKSNNINRPV
jgi:hypothetical protein